MPTTGAGTAHAAATLTSNAARSHPRSRASQHATSASIPAVVPTANATATFVPIVRPCTVAACVRYLPAASADHLRSAPTVPSLSTSATSGTAVKNITGAATTIVMTTGREKRNRGGGSGPGVRGG